MRLLPDASLWLRGIGSVAQEGTALARRYPRASVASGLSAAILAAVLVIQPGRGKHDTTASIPLAPVQSDLTSRTQTAQTDPSEPSTPSSSGPKVNDPSPNTKQNAIALAGNDLPALPGGPDSAISPGKTEELQADQKTSPGKLADRPREQGLAPLPNGDPVKLTAGEDPIALPPVEAPLAPESEQKSVRQVADSGPALAPAPIVSPVMELASADVKPGTPPESAQVPAPALPPASPLIENPTAKVVPVPKPSTTPLSAPAPLSRPHLYPPRRPQPQPPDQLAMSQHSTSTREP